MKRFWYHAKVKNKTGIHTVFYGTIRPTIGSECPGIAKPNIVISFNPSQIWKADMQINNKPKNPHAQALGRLGGKAGKGKVKARTTEQARAAVMVRWNRALKRQLANAKPDESTVFVDEPNMPIE